MACENGCIVIFKLESPIIGTCFEQSRNDPQLLTATKNVSFISHYTFESIWVITFDNIKINSIKDLVQWSTTQQLLLTSTWAPSKKLAWDPHEWSWEKTGLVEGGVLFIYLIN